MDRTKVVLMAALALVGAGCVSGAKYDEARNEAHRAKAELAAVMLEDIAEVRRLEAAISALEGALAIRERQTADSKAEVEALMDQNLAFRTELERLGRDVDSLLAEKGSLAGALADARRRLDELRRAEAVAEGRARMYRDLAMKLERMVDAGELAIRLRDGRMVLELGADVLFDTAKVDIKPKGKEALKELAKVLSSFEGRRFEVAGHTDDVPIFSERFASNWELSCGRGLEVVHFLVKQGVRAEQLSASGYGEFDPVASNTDAVGRAKNRRIEIALQPNVAEIVALPEAD